MTDRQTDRQTDGRNCDSIFALSIYAVARNKKECLRKRVRKLKAKRNILRLLRQISQRLSAVEVIFNETRYINLRFTYLLTYLLTCLLILERRSTLHAELLTRLDFGNATLTGLLSLNVTSSAGGHECSGSTCVLH